MAHFPVNHRLRPLYRTLAALCGLYVLIFGIVSLVRLGGVGFFAREGLPASLGLHANPAFAVLSIVAGAVILAGALIGGNLDRWINLVAALVFLVAGLAMLSLLRTNLNLLGFTVATCIVSFIVGLVLLTAALYGQVGSPEQQDREESFRHGFGGDPQSHGFGSHRVPRGASDAPSGS